MASALAINDQWKALIMVDQLPEHVDNHPLGCHRRRVSDLLCFRWILIRLVTGASWETVEALMEYKVSDTPMRARRDEWIKAGVFAELEAETRAGYDRIIGLDMSFLAIDGSIHKAPCGGEGTGKSPVDRGKLGHKWAVAADANGIPIGVAIDGANRHDIRLLEPTLNSWWSNYGQLRRSTYRHMVHRYAAISLASTVLMTAYPCLCATPTQSTASPAPTATAESSDNPAPHPTHQTNHPNRHRTPTNTPWVNDSTPT